MAEIVAEGYVIDPNGTLTEEFVEQDEPGVFITISSNPGGEKYLKGVRFRYVLHTLGIWTVYF